MLAQWKREEGCVPDEHVWDHLMISAAALLSSLLRAQTAYLHQGGARELVEQIAWFCHWGHTPERLATVRGGLPTTEWPDYPARADVADYPEPDQIIAALLALHEDGLRRRKERLRQRAVPTPGQDEPSVSPQIRQAVHDRMQQATAEQDRRDNAGDPDRDPGWEL
jgi:hypothetical protein